MEMTGRMESVENLSNSEEGSHLNDRFPTLPTVPWKSLTRFPHSHSPDDDTFSHTYKQQNQRDISIALTPGTFLSPLDTEAVRTLPGSNNIWRAGANDAEAGQIAVVVEHQMQFDGAFGAPELGPIEQRGAQVFTGAREYLGRIGGPNLDSGSNGRSDTGKYSITYRMWLGLRACADLVARPTRVAMEADG